MTPNEGEVQMLQAWQNNETLTLRLFENNYTPAAVTTASNFTEATFTGYAAIALSAGSWTNTGGAPSVATYPQQSFTSTAVQTKNVYGYYVVGGTSGKVYKTERFLTAPVAIAAIGDQIQVALRITLGSTVND